MCQINTSVMKTAQGCLDVYGKQNFFTVLPLILFNFLLYFKVSFMHISFYGQTEKTTDGRKFTVTGYL